MSALWLQQLVKKTVTRVEAADLGTKTLGHDRLEELRADFGLIVTRPDGDGKALSVAEDASCGARAVQRGAGGRSGLRALAAFIAVAAPVGEGSSAHEKVRG